MHFKRTTVLFIILYSATTGRFLLLIQNIYEWMNIKLWIRGSHVWSLLFGVCVCRFVTDRLSLSEIMANTDPPRNSQSHHKISFFPSLSLSLSSTNTQSFSLCSHPVRSLAFSLCLSYTHALSLSSLRPLPLVSAAVTLCPFRSVILSAAVSELAGGPTEMSGNRFCPERRRATIGHDGHLAIAAKTEFTIITPRPSDSSQRGSIRSQPASETWTKPTRPPQRPHHGQDTFSDSTIQQLRSTQTRPHKTRHGQIITNQFSRSQTETRPLNITGGIWNHPRPLSVYNSNSWSQRHQRTTRTSPNRPQMLSASWEHWQDHIQDCFGKKYHRLVQFLCL